MANQMIALQTRGPQLPDVGGIATRYANIMANTAVAREKQGAAQRANAFRQLVSSPDFDPSSPESIKAAAALDPEGAEKIARSFDMRRKAQQDFVIAEVARLRDRGAAVNDDATAEMWLNEVEKVSPADAAAFRQFMPRFDPDKMDRILMEADKYIEKKIATPRTEIVQDVAGNFYEGRTGGLGARGAVPLDVLEPQPKTGTVEMGEQTTVEPGVGGPDEYSPAQQLMLNLASVRDDAGYQTILSALDRADPQIAQQLRAVAPRFNPAVLSRVVKDANAALGGGAAPAAGSLVAGERGGVGGPLEGYVSTGRQLRGKSPMQSPMPSIPPTEDIRRKAAAERATPTETYETKRSEAQAASDVKFLDTVGAAKDQARNVLSVIDQMIGDLNVKDNKITTGKRAPHPGFESVVGAGIPGLRFIPGTQSADFDAFMEQVEGGAFLDAYESLKGTGQITEKEGEKATSAITRMKRSSSEIGFVKAAREFQDIVRRGLERAEAREARLRGGTPTAKSGGGKRLRYNPATGELE